MELRTIGPDDAASVKALRLAGVYVAPAFRGRGIGRKLLERALAHARTMPELLQVTLGVNTTNTAAIALYESAGFEQFGLERGFLRVDGALYDELHLVLRLTREPPASAR
jgi:ribosomal protein S18 acetylase RimI-like enzyme